MVFLVIALCAFMMILLFQHYHIKRQLREITKMLDDIYAGNLDRRLLADDNTEISNLVYKINEIVIKDKEQFLEFHKREKAYKKLVTSLSHDIRTPLSSLMGYLEVLEKDTVSIGEQQNFLRVAKRKASDLCDYIQTLFEWLKLESGEWVYDFKEYNICELARQILADWIMKLEENKIEYEFDLPEEAVYMSTDQNAFRRILNNLLANIVKHSHTKKLDIKIHHTLQELQISITDYGVGIDKEELPFIFERLYKCDTSRTNHSNGLGLAIARELTTALHGEISADSSLGEWTTFYLKFSKA